LGDGRYDAIAALKDLIMQIGGGDRQQGGEFGSGIAVGSRTGAVALR
jgi:hypothetical protein